MAFTHIPDVSKNQIKKAGGILVEGKSNPKYQESFNLMNEYRSAHQYPLNTFQATLRNKLSTGKYGHYEQIIVAQRVKRMPTIIDKLKREPSMQPTTMGDIGGLRAILGTVKHVQMLATKYDEYKIKNRFFKHKLLTKHDYIASPKSSGYRGIHFIYEYNNDKSPGSDWNGLRIELQIRTKLQHSWATALETIDMIHKHGLKFKKGPKDWHDFFIATSAAFSIFENCPVVGKYKSIEEKKIYKTVMEMERKLNVISTLDALAFLITGKHSEKQKSAFYLLVLNSEDKTILIEGFPLSQIKEAQRKNAFYDEKTLAGEPIDAVLVSAGSVKSVKKSYPNYFGNTKEFTTALTKIIELAK